MLKNGKNSNLLVIMRVILLQKNGLHNLMNSTRLKKERARNKLQKLFTTTAEFVS